MSSYCANNTSKCEQYADELFSNGKVQVFFDDLIDEQKKQVCEYCDSERIESYNWAYDQYKDRISEEQYKKEK